jgi:hypothetical protein
MRMVHLIMCGLVVILFLAVWNVGQAQDSLGMHHVARLDYWPNANDIHMVGDLAYAMGGTSGLHIMSLADPANPMELGRYTQHVGGCTGGVYVTGNQAYLSLCDTGVVLDVSDPANLITLGVWEAPGNLGISDITLVHGDIAIARSDEAIPYILDVSDPSNVHYIGEFTEEPGPVALGMAGEYLCMMGSPGGVVLYDISDPAHPQRVAACDTASRAWGGTMSGDYAYLAANEIHIINLTNPLQPVLAALSDTLCYDVTVTGVHAITSCGGLHVWNVADPANPIFEGEVEYPYPGAGYCFQSIYSSEHLVCARNSGGCTLVASVIDISNPTTPTIVSGFGNYGILMQSVISGAVGYVADSRVGLRTIDLANPDQIYELANMYRHSHGASSLAIRGNYAYEAVGYYRLFVADISNPAQPESLWCLGWTMQNDYLRVLTVGDYLYAFDYTGAPPSYLRTYDLTNPEVPELVNSLAIPQLPEGPDFGMTASNGYLYFVQYNYFRIYSLANPAAPQLIGSCGLPVPNFYAYGFRVVVTGNYAYVANCGGGLVIVNIANPGNPTVVTSVEGYYSGVAVSENILIADNPYSGIDVMDISNPTYPSVIGYYSTHEFIGDMDIQGQYLFTTSETDFHVYQVDALTGAATPEGITPHEFTLYPCYPNPFNPNTVIRFSLPHVEHAKLTIYDVTGRQVKVLANEVLDAGEHRVTFDGSSLASGIYFARMQGRDFVGIQKMVLLK